MFFFCFYLWKVYSFSVFVKFIGVWNKMGFFGYLLFVFCLLTTSLAYEEELRAKGELRLGCSKRGYVAQPERRVNTTDRLNKLRKVMQNEVLLGTAPIHALLVLSEDDHQNLDVSEHDRRRQYISGFSGASANAIITSNTAALWTDGRYHLQADEQLNCDWLLLRTGYRNVPTETQWLRAHLSFGSRVGVDPRIISEHMWQQWVNELRPSGLELVALNVSLIDIIWTAQNEDNSYNSAHNYNYNQYNNAHYANNDAHNYNNDAHNQLSAYNDAHYTNSDAHKHLDDFRPAQRHKDAFVWDLEYAGQNYTSKLSELRSQMNLLNADAMIVTALDEISWLLNVKGRDVPYSPFLRSYAIVEQYDVYLYVNRSQLVRNGVVEYFQAAHPYLVTDTIIIRDYDAIWDDLRTKSQKYTNILVPTHCVYSPGASHAIYEHIPREKILSRQSPIIYLKAVKNEREILGMRQAQIQDAAALCQALAYFEKRFSFGDIFTELDMAKSLDEHRYEQNNSLGNSFRTIVGFGSNAAQPNYEPTPNTNAEIWSNSTVLLDSGGQYLNGTTKVARTLHFGNPSEEEKEAYTRVLIGTIQLSTFTFPSTMRMATVDVLARFPLWEVGLDYLHETGHGIGAFSGVRESPIKVHFDSQISSQQGFKPGYFLTSEPGFYRESDFGVRLSNVMQVIRKPWLRHTSGHEFLGFEVVTLVPFEPKFFKLSLLSLQQRQWLNHYNEQVRIHVGAELKKQNKMDGFYWMMDKTKYIPEYGRSAILSVQPLIVLLINVYLLFAIVY